MISHLNTLDDRDIYNFVYFCLIGIIVDSLVRINHQHRAHWKCFDNFINVLGGKIALWKGLCGEVTRVILVIYPNIAETIAEVASWALSISVSLRHAQHVDCHITVATGCRDCIHCINGSVEIFCQREIINAIRVILKLLVPKNQQAEFASAQRQICTGATHAMRCNTRKYKFIANSFTWLAMGSIMPGRTNARTKFVQVTAIDTSP